MKNQERIILIIILFSILIATLITNERKKIDSNVDYEIEEQTIENIKFYQEPPKLFKPYKKFVITTNKQTIVWNNRYKDNVKFVESDDGTNKITYGINYKGEYIHRTIHLNPEGLKKYSKTYGDTFGETLTLTKDGD